MWYVEDHFRVKLGGVTYIDVGTLILLAYPDGQTKSLFDLKRSDSNGLEIYFDIFDEHGERVAAVRRNQIYYGDKDKYESTESMDRYIMTEKSTGRTICDIKKRAEALPDELEVSFHLYTPDGVLLDATPTSTTIPGATLLGGTMTNCGVGIRIDVQRKQPPVEIVVP